MEIIYRIRLLGPIQVEKQGVPMRGFESRKALALLGYLVRQDQAVSRSQLAGLFWGDKTEARGRRNLSRELSQLSAHLPDCFQADYYTVQFQPTAAYWVDTVAFDELVKGAGQTTVSGGSAQEADETTELLEGSGDSPASQAATEIQPARLAEAVALYRGDFMTGFYLDDCPEFETWLVREQEAWRRQVSRVLDRLIIHHSLRDQDDQAQSYASRWLALEPWRERAHRYMMILLARNGQRSAALAQYEICRRALDEELGVEPAAETAALYDRIRTGEMGRRTAEPAGQGAFLARQPGHAATPPAAPPVPRPNIPIPATPLISREEELAQIAERLANPDCHLLTLVGPGGIGKTRLALEIARQLTRLLLDEDLADEKKFTDGVYFIPLDSLSSADFLISTIVDALEFSFYSGVDPTSQLLNYLHEKRMLLVLDNFEHLLAGAGLLIDILKNAPNIKIMVVSRERLNLREEWILPIQGLRVPEAPPDLSESGSEQTRLNGRRGWEGVEKYSAMQLFLQQARTIYPEFSLSEEEIPFVIRICQLVEGIPLAIELAAAWVRMLACHEIAEEIEHNLDFLATSLRNVPERHRSLRAVFDHSWQLLSTEERQVFSKLAVIRGGFRREAAERISGASLPLLLALVDKSLLHIQAGRYLRHILLWQYAVEKLAEAPQEKEKVEELHCDYYVAFLRQREARLQGGKQKEALAEISAEIENVRTAWRWAVEQGQTTALEQAMGSLFHFYDMHSWFKEGAEIFGWAAARLAEERGSGGGGEVQGSPSASLRTGRGAEKREENPQIQNPKSKIQNPKSAIVLAKLLARQGWFTFQLGRQEPARVLLKKSLAMLRGADVASGARREMIFALNYLGAVYRHLGEYGPAKQHLAESLVICREVGDPYGLSIALNNLGQVAYLQGDYGQARQLCQESLAIKREIGDRWGMTFSLNNLGQVAYTLAEYVEAREFFQESLAICQAIGDRRGIGLCLNHLGNVARTIEAHQEAKELYRESLAIFKEIGNQWGIIFSLANLGDVVCALGEYQTAKGHFNEALKMALDIQAVPLTVDILLGVAVLLMKTGRPDRALRILALLLTHSAGSRDTQDKAAKLLAELEPQLPAELMAAAQAGAETGSLEGLAEEILRAGLN